MVTAFDELRDRWSAVMGSGIPMAVYTPASVRGFHGQVRIARAHDTAVTATVGMSALHTAGVTATANDYTRVWIVRRGGWTLGDARGHVEHRVRPGEFLVQGGPLSHFSSEPDTTSQVIVLPTMRRRGVIRGLAGSAEARLLWAHASMIERIGAGLAPAGLRAARDSLLELAGAVMHGPPDDGRPALALAAKELAERRLTERDLSPDTLARALNVSVRTLQRAFSGTGETVSSHIRDRRLAHARRDLTVRGLSIAAVAARWHFADSSHFVRAFKRHYGCTPGADLPGRR